MIVIKIFRSGFSKSCSMYYNKKYSEYNFKNSFCLFFTSRWPRSHFKVGKKDAISASCPVLRRHPMYEAQ